MDLSFKDWVVVFEVDQSAIYILERTAALSQHIRVVIHGDETDVAYL